MELSKSEKQSLVILGIAVSLVFIFFVGRSSMVEDIKDLKELVRITDAQRYIALHTCNLTPMDTDVEEFGSDQIFIQQVFNCNGNMIALNTKMSGNLSGGGAAIYLDEVIYIGKIDPKKDTYHLYP